jgi:hypothetical protein
MLGGLPEKAQQGPDDNVDIEDEGGAQHNPRQKARPQLFGEAPIEDDFADDRGEDRDDQTDEREHSRVIDEAERVDLPTEVLERDRHEGNGLVDPPPDEGDLLDVELAQEGHGRVGVLPDHGLGDGHLVVEEEEPGHDQEEDRSESSQRLFEEQGLVLDDVEAARDEAPGRWSSWPDRCRP